MSDARRSALDAERRVPVERHTAAGRETASDLVAVEEPLEIRLHERPFVVVMRTPGRDRELAAGFLLAEGLIADAGELGAVEHCRHPDEPDAHNVVNVFLMGNAREGLDGILAGRRHVVANASCGVCGRRTIESLATRAAPVRGKSVFDAQALLRFPDALRTHQSIFDRTGGLHGAALFTTDGALAAVAEDVGRHNAVDKVVGAMLLSERLPLTGHALVVSGRTSFEIVQKAWLAGVEVICAVSAPSSLAVEVASAAGVTLVGFVRQHSFNIYSHPERIRGV